MKVQLILEKVPCKGSTTILNLYIEKDNETILSPLYVNSMTQVIQLKGWVEKLLNIKMLDTGSSRVAHIWEAFL